MVIIFFLFIYLFIPSLLLWQKRRILYDFSTSHQQVFLEDEKHLYRVWYMTRRKLFRKQIYILINLLWMISSSKRQRAGSVQCNARPGRLRISPPPTVKAYFCSYCYFSGFSQHYNTLATSTTSFYYFPAYSIPPLSSTIQCIPPR